VFSCYEADVVEELLLAAHVCTENGSDELVLVLEGLMPK